MKKTLTTVFLALLLVFVTAYSAACSKQQLETPQNIVIDDSYRMTWEDVENSRGYTVAITYPSGETDEEVARRANYSLESLEMGDYEIRVKAVGDNGFADSPWSDTIYFHRDYENGCFYQKTADGMAYTLTSYGTATGDVDVGDTYRGKPVLLSSKEYALLAALAERQGVVWSRGQLEEKLYNWDNTVGSNAIEVHIHHLRKKLSDSAIKTVRGVGYLLET